MNSDSTCGIFKHFFAEYVYLNLYSITSCIIAAVGLLGVPGDVFLTDLQEALALSHHGSTVDIYTNSWGENHRVNFWTMGSLTKAAIDYNIAHVSLIRWTCYQGRLNELGSLIT
jgi:hypothetical protein